MGKFVGEHCLIKLFGDLVLDHRSEIHIKKTNQGPLIVCGGSADLGSCEIPFACVHLCLYCYKKIDGLVDCPADVLSCAGEAGESFGVASPNTHKFLEVVGYLLEHLLSEGVDGCLVLVVSYEGVGVSVVDLNPDFVGVVSHNVVLTSSLVGGGRGRGYIDFDWFCIESARVVSTGMLGLLPISEGKWDKGNKEQK